jgi:hypothetical protein
MIPVALQLTGFLALLAAGFDKAGRALRIVLAAALEADATLLFFIVREMKASPPVRLAGGLGLPSGNGGLGPLRQDHREKAPDLDGPDGQAPLALSRSILHSLTLSSTRFRRCCS